MKRSIKSLLATLVVTTGLVVPSLAAQNSGMMLTGAEFLKACTRPDMEWISFCNGYVQAVFDGAHGVGRGICAPSTLTRTKIVVAVVQALTAKPALKKLNAADVVFDVLYRAFPCQ